MPRPSSTSFARDTPSPIILHRSGPSSAPLGRSGRAPCRSPNWVPAPTRLLVEGTGAVLLDRATLYLRIDQLRDPPGSSWAGLIGESPSRITGVAEARLIIDIRDCIGGDGELVPALIEWVKSRSAARPPRRDKGAYRAPHPFGRDHAGERARTPDQCNLHRPADRRRPQSLWRNQHFRSGQQQVAGHPRQSLLAGRDCKRPSPLDRAARRGAAHSRRFCPAI